MRLLGMDLEEIVRLYLQGGVLYDVVKGSLEFTNSGDYLYLRFDEDLGSMGGCHVHVLVDAVISVEGLVTVEKS